MRQLHSLHGSTFDAVLPAMGVIWGLIRRAPSFRLNGSSWSSGVAAQTGSLAQQRVGCPKAPRHAVVSRGLAHHIAADVLNVFPFGDTLEFDGAPLKVESIIAALEPSLSLQRLSKITKVIAQRTFSVTPIVEGVYDMGNLAAICRTADGLGYGAVHYINTSDDKYKRSRRTSLGAEKWLHTRVWRSTRDCVHHFHRLGCQVVAAHVNDTALPVQDVDWTRPSALIVGNEAAGVSAEALACCDVVTAVPMAGFSGSLNVSVATALLLYEARRQRQHRLGDGHADLSHAQRRTLRALFLLRDAGLSREELQALLERPPPPWQAHFFRAKSTLPF